MKKCESSKVQLLIGYLSAIGAVTMNATSSSCVQALQGAFPDFQLSVARSVVQLVLYLIGGRLIGAEFKVKKETITGLLYLSVAYMAINVGAYGASTYIPLTEVAGIVLIGAIVTAFFLSRFLSHKDISKSNIIASIVCGIGIILTVQPALLFKHMTKYCDTNSSSFQNVSVQPLNSSGCSEGYISKHAMSIGYVLGIVGGVGSGATYHITGIMLEGIKPVVKATYAASFCVIGSIAFMFYLEDPVLVINLRQLMLVLGHAVMSAISSFLVIQAAHHVPAPSLAVVFSFDIVTNLICQYTIMHSLMPGNYNLIEVFGCMVIISGASTPAILDILAHNAKADELP